ncbi:PAS domain S-box protein [Skermanella sp. TT6]|uniref:histidine kinase n=1 Tax=Skermanella cutis TaxID=2775420 RepID=A0ABX7B4M0_9PROT|nr:hybrid sensor histidine kinase/response regulator [Skermanella sp. TT6]QQP89304.1 PAS domain S-box protein [Skermanella sp. TT6]
MPIADLLAEYFTVTGDVIMVTETEPFAEPGPVITYVSPAFERLTGYPAEYAVGRSPRFLQGGGTDRAALARIRAALERRRPIREDLLNYRRDGTPFWIELAIHPITDARGRLRCFLSVLHDITERKRIEAMLRDAESEARQARRTAEEATLARSRFFAAASHDLRQPYQAIRLLHQLLADRLVDPAHRALAEKLGEAIQAGESLLNVLLDVSALEAGTIRPRMADVAVEGLLTRLAHEMEPQAQAAGLRFRVRPCRASVRSDPVLLQRMISNLLSNALRYTPSGGILLGCRRRGGAIRIEVWDTGIGIPEENLGDVFEDFIQLGNPERDRSRGLGLGLAVVARMAKLLDHRIEVRSVPGRGSMFAVTVPLSERRGGAEVPAAPAPGKRRLEGRTAIVIDDDPIVLESLALVIESWGMSAVRVVSLDELHAALAGVTHPPDLVLADYRLQGDRSGSDAVELVRSRCGTPVPALLLTGDTHPDRLREAAAHGYRILHKPIHPAVLRDQVELLLDQATLPSGSAAVPPAPSSAAALASSESTGT